MSQHTPGPWAHREKPGPRDVTLRRLHWEVGSLKTEEGVAIAFIGEANARLIAAAPDLLAGLKAAREFIVTALDDLVKLPGFEARNHAQVKAIDSLIAKAEGRQS